MMTYQAALRGKKLQQPSARLAVQPGLLVMQLPHQNRNRGPQPVKTRALLIAGEESKTMKMRSHCRCQPNQLLQSLPANHRSWQQNPRQSRRRAIHPSGNARLLTRQQEMNLERNTRVMGAWDLNEALLSRVGLKSLLLCLLLSEKNDGARSSHARR